ncbi:D-alanyl-D-alanine carboxypeptidase family protein [Polycladidibacter hongkongensis]|uniref:D-alanyl-D-alanine carboxypeptidase family protein n=1 Tax=Polycladidibacter hongkongensis TaxID=1647556 RepID=UPI00083345B3|nr:D-alanyl-D-alanine carboxypeptidase family protein [Pseudovibrio hongkongensis]
MANVLMRVWGLSFLLFCIVLPLKAMADVAAWIAIDARNGKVLQEHNAFDRWYPASLTKMMTGYIAFSYLASGKIAPQDTLVISKAALAMPPSKMGFKVGTQVTLDNALAMIMVKSANDIAFAMGERIGGSAGEFAVLMNAYAKELGMRHTHFVNPHGLPDSAQVTTARDMAVLAQRLWNDFPQYRGYMRQAGIRFGRRTMPSGNKDYLLRTEGASGIKTGYICDSGYNVAAAATRGDRTIIAVVLGAGSTLERAAFTSKLMDSSFKKTSGPNLRQFAEKGRKAPPEKGYCKRNSKSNAQQLVNRFGSKRQNASMLAYSKSRSPAADGVNIYYTKEGSKKIKTNWGKVYEEILGPKLRSYEPLVVRAGAGRSVGQIRDFLGLDGRVPTPHRKPSGVVERASVVDRHQRKDPFALAANQNNPSGLRPLAGNGSGSLMPLGRAQAGHTRNNSGKQLFGAPGGLFASPE